MENKYSEKELGFLDGYAQAVLPVIVAENLKNGGGEDFPEIYPEIADMSYAIAEAMLEKRNELIGRGKE
jgi:hypothetical protein